jgi:hypothetical protein
MFPGLGWMGHVTSRFYRKVEMYVQIVTKPRDV